MNKDMIRVLSVVAVASAVVAGGCRRKYEPEPVGMAERTGAALDTAAEKTVEGAKATAAATREVAGKAVEKTGAALEKAGAAIEGAGESMRELPPDAEEKQM